MNKKVVSTGSGYGFFVDLSIFSIVATLWFIYTLLPYTETIGEETAIIITGFYAALLGMVSVSAGRNSIEHPWNQKVLSRVCIDTFILILAGLLIVSQWMDVSALAVLLTIMGLASTDVIIRQTIVRKIEG